MSYSEFHNVVDGLDVILFIVVIVGAAWTWFGTKGDKYE